MNNKLKPYPKYKDSGIEWLGEVPEGWKIKKLKYLSRLNMGQSPDSAVCNSEGIGIAFLQGNADFTDKFPKERYYTTEPKKIATIGSVPFSVRAPVGAVNIADKDYAIGRGLCAIDISDLTNHGYFLYWINCLKVQFNAIQMGSTFESITAEQLSSMIGAMPNPQEQTAIANYLDQQTAKIDQVIDKAQQAIVLLKEKRISLITHVVTGKVDVRESI